MLLELLLGSLEVRDLASVQYETEYAIHDYQEECDPEEVEEST